MRTAAAIAPAMASDRADPQRVVQAGDVLGRRAAAERGLRGHEGAEARHADRDPGLAERVVHAGGQAALLDRGGAEGDRGHRRVEEADAEGGGQEARHEDRPGAVGPGERHEAHADRDQREPAGDHDPGGDLLAHGARGAGDDEHHDRGGEVDQAGLDRGQPEHLLQVQRDVQEDREERGRDRGRRDLRAGEVRVAEQPEGQHRLLHAMLDHDERGEQDHGGGERGHDRRAPPPLLVAAQQREHEQEQAGAQGDLTRDVDAAGARITRLAHVHAGDPDAGDAERDVHEEDPLPVQAAGERATDERADGERCADRRAVGGQCTGALLRAREGVGEDREGDGEHDRGADALHGAGCDERVDAGRRGARRGGEGEQRQARGEEPSTTEAVGQGAEGEDGRGEGERVRVDDPLQATEARVEVLGDAREGRVDDRDVEHEHRGGGADDREGPVSLGHAWRSFGSGGVIESPRPRDDRP